MTTWGSVAHHELTVQPALNRRKRCRTCSRPRRAATHVGCANGIATMSGCEWHAYQWLRETLARRRGS